MSSTESVPAVTESLSSLIETLIKSSNDISNRHREMSRTLRRVAVDIEREQKRAAKGKTRERKPTQQKSVAVNKTMSDFMAKHAGEEKSEEGRWTRHQMQRVISRYIREQKLAVETDKKQWVPDATLIKALGLTKGEKYSYMIVNGLLSKVIVQQ